MTHRLSFRGVAAAAAAIALGAALPPAAPAASAQDAPARTDSTRTTATAVDTGASTHVPGHTEGYWTPLRICLAIPAPMPGTGSLGWVSSSDVPRLVVGSLDNNGVLASVQAPLERIFCSR